MCLATNFDGNKVQVCTVGDLKPGDQYRTPDGGGVLVIDNENRRPESPMVDVVIMNTGVLYAVAKNIRLGRDRAGRLYASRYLNQATPNVVVDPVLSIPERDDQ